VCKEIKGNQGVSLKKYRKKCDGCKTSKGQGDVRKWGGVIKLNGNWILNHYRGEEGFLGWLALQPRYHREELTQLEADELEALGGNIKKIDEALGEYWSKHFKGDEIERVYAVYFSEYSKHLHFHLIPRTKETKRFLYTCGSIIPWDVPKISSCPCFPPKYRTEKGESEEVLKLMRCLKATLSVQ
jgi:diadenosine tetraphosphate (Ap4A) HIT family hydrolase